MKDPDERIKAIKYTEDKLGTMFQSLTLDFFSNSYTKQKGNKRKDNILKEH